MISSGIRKMRLILWNWQRSENCGKVIMFALVKISRPSPTMLMVPDDDFWHEAIDDE